MRAEPSRLPWGYGLEISLTGVETAAGYVPTTGGMRLGFTPREGDTELFVLSFVLQLCMLPMMARDFHRIPLLGPVVNVFVVPLMGVIVPFGFVTLGVATLLPRLALLAAHP